MRNKTRKDKKNDYAKIAGMKVNGGTAKAELNGKTARTKERRETARIKVNGKAAKAKKSRKNERKNGETASAKVN